jgi:hypothetical protein
MGGMVEFTRSRYAGPLFAPSEMKTMPALEFFLRAASFSHFLAESRGER